MPTIAELEASKQGRAEKQELYERVFNEMSYQRWGDSPFSKEIADLSFAKALSTFVKRGRSDISYRRKVLFESLLPYYSNEDDEDAINRAFYRLPADNSLVQRALSLLCQVYNEPPVRTTGNDKFDELLTDANYDDMLNISHRYSKALNRVCVMPYTQGKELKFYLLTPDMFRAKYKDGELEELWILYPVPIETKTEVFAGSDLKHELQYYYKVVTKTETRYMKNDTEQFKEPKPHNYGRVPAEILNLDYSSDYDFISTDTGWWELIELQIFANEAEFVSKENLVSGTLGFWFAKNMELEDRSNLGPSRVLRVPAKTGDAPDPDVNYKTALLQVNDIQEFKDLLIREKSKAFGIPPSIVNEEYHQLSGVAMQADRIELEQIRKEDISKLKNFDKRLTGLCALIVNSDRVLSFKLDYSLTYRDLRTLNDPLAELEYNNELLKNRVITYEEYASRAGNDKTQEQYIEDAKNDKEFQTQIKEIYGNEPGGFTDPDNEPDSSADPNDEPAQTDGSADTELDANNIEDGTEG